MSYILVAWEQPIPRSMEEVGPLVRTLRADKAMVSSARADAFMARLWEKYPRDLDGEDEDYVWDDSFPFAPQPRPRLIYLSISFPHIDEVMPFVLRTARENGLVVYDSEAGTAFLPTGRFLGKPPLPPEAPAPKAFDARAIQATLDDWLSAVFKPIGFEWVKIQAWDLRFVRKFEGGWQSVKPKIDVDPDLGQVKVDYLLAAFLDAADPMMGVKTGTKEAADAFVATTFLSDFVARTGSKRLEEFERSGSSWLLRDAVGLQRFVEASTSVIVQELLPLLDHYRSMEDFGRHALDRAARGVADVLTEPTIIRLAAIAAAAPERYDDAVRRELAACDVRVAELEARVPARPAQVEKERRSRASLEAFANKFRETLV